MVLLDLNIQTRKVDFSLPSQGSLLMAADPYYIASAWTTQRTQIPTVFLLLRACLLRPLYNNSRCVHSHEIMSTENLNTCGKIDI
jgi:hypothetical protein